MEAEKIGIVSLCEVKTTGRRCYIKLDPKVVETYAIKIGDVLKVEIQAKMKRPGAEAE